MTHTPPIPTGNQSPYPLQEAPHKPTGIAPRPGDPRIARTPDHVSVTVPAVIALAAGVGIAAIAGGLFYAFSGKAKPKPKKRKPGPRKTKATKASDA